MIISLFTIKVEIFLYFEKVWTKLYFEMEEYIIYTEIFSSI
jgi:hypothetical protein